MSEREATGLDAGLYRALVIESAKNEIAKNARRGVVTQFHSYFSPMLGLQPDACFVRSPSTSLRAGSPEGLARSCGMTSAGGICLDLPGRGYQNCC
jgi:hypothetical protein